jgi:hypothetical protein
LLPVGAFRLGPTFDLDQTFNEGNLERYNLQSYRPGLMADTTWDHGTYKLRPRVAYVFTHDEFNGSTFGNKHSLATSLGAIWNRCHVSTVLWAIDSNDLFNDGPEPVVTSQDGWSNTIGVIHDWIRPGSTFRSFRTGLDMQHVDAQGSTYRFVGGSVYSQAVFVPMAKTEWSVKGGWAYRDYYDFALSPSRDTHILRASTELRRYFDHGFSVALFARYDDFLSRNDNFDPTRFLSGGVATWEY